VYQAGTLSGNPLAMAAGVATLIILQKGNPYPYLEKRAEKLAEGFRNAAEKHGIPFRLNRVGSMSSFFFTGTAVTDRESAQTADTARFTRYFNAMLENGVYLAPSQFEACFISAAHSDEDIDMTIDAHDRALKNITA